MINGYKLFRRERNCHGEGILNINENIPSKISPVNVEGIEKDYESFGQKFLLKLANGYVLVSTNHLHKMKTIS